MNISFNKDNMSFELNNRGQWVISFGYQLRLCVSYYMVKETKISEAAMITTLLLTFVKRKQKKK